MFFFPHSQIRSKFKRERNSEEQGKMKPITDTKRMVVGGEGEEEEEERNRLASYRCPWVKG